MNILQINTADRGGGAESSARNLHLQYQKHGYTSYLAVGRKFTNDSTVVKIPLTQNNSLLSTIIEPIRSILEYGQQLFQPISRLRTWLPRLTSWSKFKNWTKGGEDCFGYGIESLINSLPIRPDIIHCHNLHGSYFNLESLIKLSQQFPVIVNLRDEWLLTGHCSYTFSCDKWKYGCGDCPNLKIYPSIRKDRTKQNWEIKKNIYEKSKLYVVANSKWTLEKSKQSMLKAINYTVIENGIDKKKFKPGNKLEARKSMNFNESDMVIMFAASNIKKNLFKDYLTMEKSIYRVAEKFDKSITFICVGENNKVKKTSNKATIIFTGHVDDIKNMVNYYQAADIYIHAAVAEASGKTITEALSCGTPVIATDIGGIPEQVIDGVNGFLCKVNDYKDMSDKIITLLRNDTLRQKMSIIAPGTVKRFDINNQVNQFINYYKRVIDDFHLSKMPKNNKNR